jgi:hypothetical protein
MHAVGGMELITKGRKSPHRNQVKATGRAVVCDDLHPTGDAAAALVAATSVS